MNESFGGFVEGANLNPIEKKQDELINNGFQQGAVEATPIVQESQQSELSNNIDNSDQGDNVFYNQESPKQDHLEERKSIDFADPTVGNEEGYSLEETERGAELIEIMDNPWKYISEDFQANGFGKGEEDFSGVQYFSESEYKDSVSKVSLAFSTLKRDIESSATAGEITEETEEDYFSAIKKSFQNRFSGSSINITNSYYNNGHVRSSRSVSSDFGDEVRIVWQNDNPETIASLLKAMEDSNFFSNNEIQDLRNTEETTLLTIYNTYVADVFSGQKMCGLARLHAAENVGLVSSEKCIVSGKRIFDLCYSGAKTSLEKHSLLLTAETLGIVTKNEQNQRIVELERQEGDKVNAERRAKHLASLKPLLEKH